MKASKAQALDQRIESLTRGQEADMCLQAYPELPGEPRYLLPVVQRITADADQVTMPQGFWERVWQKMVARSGGSLPPRPAKHKA